MSRTVHACVALRREALGFVRGGTEPNALGFGSVSVAEHHRVLHRTPRETP